MSLVTSSAIGRAPDDPEGQLAAFAGGNMRGVRFAPTGKHRWGYAFRYRAGRSGGSTPAARAAAYLMTGSAAAAARIGYSAQANLSTLMVNGSGTDSGDWITSPVALVDAGPTNNAMPVPSGSSVLLAILMTGASGSAGMIEAGLIDGYDETFYDRSGLSQPPPSVYGSNTPSTQGHLTVALLCHDNAAPLAPANATPGSTSEGSPQSISETNPVFGADHLDLNGAYGASSGDGYNDGDYLNQYRIELQVKNGASWDAVWSPTMTADGPMRASNHFSVTYPGTLTRGSLYRWRCQTSDYFDAWGALSGWRYFTPANLGLVTLAGAPTGKIETQQPAFAFSWSHQSALSTNAVEIQLYRNGTLSQASPTISKTVANNASGTISWAESAFTTLLWGQSYSYRVRGRDTGSVWSAWSPLRTFTTNASPGIPDGLSPSNSQIVTSLPLLSCRMVDADDTVATGLEAKVRISGPYAVTNGALPANVTGWTAAALAGTTKTFTFDGADGRAANGSGKSAITASTAAAGTAFTILNDTQLPVVAGESYTARIAAKTSNVNITPRVYIAFYNAANSLLIAYSEADWTPTINTWSDRSVTATAPANSAYCKIGISSYNDTANQTGNLWIDDASLDSGMHFVRSATYNVATGLWEYQTVSGDLPAFGACTWDAYSYDGTIYSGGVTTEANAWKSAAASFTYASGPVVTITAPVSAAVLANSTPTVTWTCATQNRYRVRVYEPGTSTVVYERGWITSSGVKSWAIEAGYLRNGHAYELEVGAEDVTPLQGFSARLPFTTSYTPPVGAANMAAVPVAIGNDPWPTAIQVQADASTIDPALFVCRNIYRDDLPGRPIARLASASATAWLDATPVSGETHTYSWRDVAYVDTSHTEQIESAAATSAASVRLRGVVLTSVLDPENRRVCLSSVQERTRKRGQDKARLMTWGSDKPITFYGVGDYITISGTYRLISTEAQLAIDIERQIDRMLDARHTYCYRDERGRRYFVTLDESAITDRRVMNADLALTLVEEAYTEGLPSGGGA